MIITAETVVQNDGSILINKVLTLSKKVNKMIETIIETIILQVWESPFQVKVPEKITGITGNTQGARTLSIPAKKDTIIRIIRIGEKLKAKG